MPPEIINSLIESLEFARARPGMMGCISREAVHGFNGGIHCIWVAFGLNPSEFRDKATQNRGWVFTSTGGVNMMEAKGLTEAQIMDELLAIQIEMLRLYAASSDEKTA